MANTKITELTALTQCAATDVLPIVKVSANTTKKVSISDLLRNAPAGTAGAPSIANADDQDTGILFPAANSIGVSTGGTQRLVIDSSGNVGIGTTSPGQQLHVNSGTADTVARFESTDGRARIQFVDSSGTSRVGGDGDDIAFYTSASASEKMRINSSGNVGIGTTSPNVTGFGSTVATINIATSSNGGLELTKNNVAAGHFTVESGASNDIRVGAVGGSAALTFQTGGSERARIDSSGRLLVGTSTSPSGGDGHAQNARLLVRGRVGVDADSGRLNLQRGSAAVNGSSIGSISFTDSSNNIYARIESFGDGTTGTDDYPGRITFSTTADGASSVTERMRIDSSGNVGIGTSSPNQVLHVTDGTTSRSFQYKAGTNELFSSSEYDATGTTTSLLTLRSRGSSNWRHAGLVKTGNTIALLNSNTNSDITTGSGIHVNSSGNVGIGHTSPASLLTVGGDVITTAKPTVSIAPSSGNGSITLRGGSPTLYFDQTGGGDGTIIYDNSSDLLFKNGTLDSSTERMRIDSSGNVGIGISSPASILHVVKNSTNNTPLSHNYPATQSGVLVSNNQTGTTGAFSAVTLRAYNSLGSGQSASIIAQSTGSGYSPSLLFTQRSGSGTNAERMRIDSSGRLLVGTSSAPTGGLPQFSRFTVSLNNDAASNGGQLNLAGNARGSLSIGDALGQLLFTDSTNGTYGSIQCQLDATPGNGDYPGRLVFSTTADGASSPTERMRINSSGWVLIGTTSEANTTSGVKFNQSGQAFFVASNNPPLQCNRLGGDGTVVSIRNDSTQVGTISVSGSTTAYNETSDYRLKENVVDITDGITRVKQLQPKRFNFIVDADTTVDGFLAHEAQTVVPEAVTGTHNEVDDDGNPLMQQIDKSKLVPLLTAALQEAIAKIETLETKVAALEAQ